MAELTLETPVQYVKGVGPTRATQLAQLGIGTVEDLLTYFPFRFDLRRQAQPIGSLIGTEDSATIAGEVLEVAERRFGARPFFQAQIQDDSGWVFAKWFHGGYLRDRIHSGMHVAIHGKVSIYREHVQFVNPRHQILWDSAGARLDQDELMPVYPAGGKLTSAMIGAIIRRALPDARRLIPRWFSREYLSHRGLPPRPQAIEAMHHPEDTDQWSAARRRLAYDECLVMQLGIALTRMREVSRPAYSLAAGDEIDRRIRARFPFELTDAQNGAIAEIVAP